MALIIEDGSGIDSANAYADIAAFKAYCDARGIDYGAATDAALEVHIIKAMDYLESKRDQYQGSKTDPAQSLQFPRNNVKIDGAYLNNDEIPRELIYGQHQLSAEIMGGGDPLPNKIPSTTGGQVIKKKVDGIEIGYSASTTTSFTPSYGKVDALLAVVMRNSGLFAIRA